MPKYCDKSCFDASHGCSRADWCECDEGTTAPPSAPSVERHRLPITPVQLVASSETIEVEINGRTVRGSPSAIRKLLGGA